MRRLSFLFVCYISSTVLADVQLAQTIAESKGIKRSPATEDGYYFVDWCNTGQIPPKKNEQGKYDTCEVGSIFHQIDHTAIELQNCLKVCNVSIKLSEEFRKNFLMEQLYNIFNSHMEIKKNTKVIIDLQTKKIAQVSWGHSQLTAQ